MTGEIGGLHGVRVLDASTVLAAPLMSSLLGDFGAEVIKVEQPKVGDPTRQFQPVVDGVSLASKVTNRNKRSVTLDLHSPQGVSLLYQLVEKCDVVVTNFRPDKLVEWSIDYSDLSAHNPALIMMHLSAFGRTGPYAKKPGFARVAESFAGLTYINGYPDRPPVFNGYPIADGIGGVYGAFAIMVAMRHREITGEGQLIDMALYEPLLRIMEDFVVAYGDLGTVKERRGNSQPHVVPNDVFPTRDGQVVLPASTANMWSRLAALIDDDGLTCLNTNELRLRNRELVDAKVADFTAKYSTDELLRLFDENSIAASRLFSIADIFDDPHIAARENLTQVFDPELGRNLTMQAPVPQFSGIRGSVRHPGRELGADTDDVLGELLGLTETEISRLREEGVI